MVSEEIHDRVLAEITADRCTEICARLLEQRCDPGGRWLWPPEKIGDPMSTTLPSDLAGLLSSIGMDVEVHPIPSAGRDGKPGETLPAPLLQAYLDGSTGDRRLLYEAHYDAREVQEEKWPRDPYGAEIEDDIIYGRGAVDSKGQLAPMIVAIEAIQQAGVELSGDLILSTGGDGEFGGNGWHKAAELDPDVDWVIAGEATYDTDAEEYEVAVAHPASFSVEIEIEGKTSHFGEPEVGINSVQELARAISSFGYRGEHVDLTHEEWAYSDESTPLPRLTITGSSSSSVSGLPNRATIEGHVEGVPGMTAAGIEDDLRAHLEEVKESIDRPDTPEYTISVELRGNGWGATEVPDDDEATEALGNAVEDVHGTRPDETVMRLVYDAAPAIARTINPDQTRGRPSAITFGGGNPELAHSDLEYIPIEGGGGLVEQAEIYAKTTLDLLY